MRDTTVTALHVPDGADADIALVVLANEIGGTPAVITHAPLRDGYTIFSSATPDGKSILDPAKNKTVSIDGRLVAETEKNSTLFPATGSQICAGDLGAPVCSNTTSKSTGNLCGLSGIVIKQEAVAESGTSTSTSTSTTGAACSHGGWQMAQLGRYADFLRQFAPDAFKPIVQDRSKVVLPGLWGYKSGGSVASCKITTAKLDPIAANFETKLTASVTFSNLETKAAPVGRFGIAPKSAPTQMRWLPARAATDVRGTSLTTAFEGAVSAAVDGDYIVGFRASANGGEVWTPCDIDGIENGVSLEKNLELKVGAGTPTTTPPSTTPQGSTPPATGSTGSTDSASEYSDSAPATEEEEEDETPTTRKKHPSSSSCSAAPPSRTTTGLPIVGILVGLAALVRRRRA